MISPSLSLSKLTKKGAFSQLWTTAIGLGIFILVTSIVALMVDEVKNINDARPTASTSSDSIAFADNTTNYSFPVIVGLDNYVQNVDAVYNATHTLGSGNYSSNSTVITLIGTPDVGTFTVNVTYSAPSVAENVTDEGLDALQVLAEWQSIIVIGIIMILIIALILKEFGYLEYLGYMG